MAIEFPNSFLAGVQLKGTPTIAVNASEGFDASTFTRVSAGIYTIELTEEVDESHILTSIQALSSTGACLICGAQIEPDHKTLAIHVQDAAGADHDGELIQIGVFLFKSA